MRQDQHNSEFDPHEVDHGTMYYKMQNGAYKGYVRGIIRGLLVGCAIGAAVGVGVFGLLSVPAILAATHLAAGTVSAIGGAGTIISAFTVFGGVMASDIMGVLGSVSGNTATQLAEQELRERYPEIQEISLDSPEPGVGYHFEVPADRDRGKPFKFRVGITGAAIGAAFGALAGPVILAAMHATGLGLVAAAPAIIGAVMGGSFGINRSIFKSIFNVTDNLLHGRIGGPTDSEKAKSRERYRRVGEGGPPSVINSLQRQEEYYRLQDGYFKKAFAAGFAGNGSGLVGGLISGGLVGILLGVVAVTALGGFAVAGMPLLFAGIVAFTMHQGMHIFTKTSFEAASHSHVHEIFHEREKALRKGLDISFDEADYNVIKRRQADPDLTSPNAREKVLFKPNVAIVMAGVGALVGTGLAPLMAGIAKLFGVAHASSGLGAVIFGVTGASFGIGAKITEGLHGIADNIYHGAYLPGDQHPDIKIHGKIPLMSPRSEFAEHLGKHPVQSNSVYHSTDVAPHSHEANRSEPMQNIIERGARSFTQKVIDNPVGEVQR